MSDQDDFEPTRVDQPAVDDPTMAMPVTPGVPPPTGPDDPLPPEGEDEDPNQNLKIAMIGVLVVVVLIVAFLFLTGSDGDDDEIEAGPTTVEAPTTETSEETESTPTTETETTTTPSTEAVAPTTAKPATSTTGGQGGSGSDCAGTGASEDDPESAAQGFIDSWQYDDRDCAKELGSDAAVNTLFGVEPTSEPGQFFGCAPAENADQTVLCSFGFIDKVIDLRMTFGSGGAWQVTDTVLSAD